MGFHLKYYTHPLPFVSKMNFFLFGRSLGKILAFLFQVRETHLKEPLIYFERIVGVEGK